MVLHGLGRDPNRPDQVTVLSLELKIRTMVFGMQVFFFSFLHKKRKKGHLV
jgi:hypothetical protein